MYLNNGKTSGLRELIPHELLIVSGGYLHEDTIPDPVKDNKELYKGADAVWFFDTNGDGRFSEGDIVESYEKNGVRYDPDHWETERAVQNWQKSDQMFQDLGAGLDTVTSNPLQSMGWVLDNLSWIFGSVKLTGSEYIDWKTGGAHRGVTSSNDLVPDVP